jgi:hypothetical protein
MSMNISVCNLGIALGAVIGGRVVDHYGAGASGYEAAVLAVGALLVALRNDGCPIAFSGRHLNASVGSQSNKETAAFESAWRGHRFSR